MKRILSKQGTRRTKKKDHIFPAEFKTFSSDNLIEKFDELIKRFEQKIPFINLIKELLLQTTITNQMKWIKSITSTKLKADDLNNHRDQYTVAFNTILSILFDTSSKILHGEITKFFNLLHKDPITKEFFMNLFTQKFSCYIKRLQDETVIQRISDINWENIQILSALIFQNFCEDQLKEHCITIYHYLSEIMHFISVDIHTVDSLHSLLEEDKLEFLLVVLIQFNKQFSFDDKINHELSLLFSSLNINASLEDFYKGIYKDETLIERLKDELKTNQDNYTYLHLCKKMIESTLNILRSPLCSKDANYSSGMWIITISRSFFKEYDQDNLIPFALTFAYSIYNEKFKDNISYSIIDLLLDSPMDKPVFCKGLNDLPPVAQLSILRAIPIVFSCQHESYNFEKDEDLPLLIRPFPDDKSTFLFDAYFELCHRWNNITCDRYTRFLSFKCIEAFSILVISILKKFPSSSLLHIKKNIPHILNTILELIWKNWEDPFDSIVGVIRVLFTYILNISDLSVELFGDEPSYGSEFINNIVSNLLSMDWSTKGKYPLLQEMVKRQGAEYFLSLEPKLMYHLFGTLSYNPYAKHIANICECILDDLKTTNQGKAETIWVEPFLQSILDVRSYESTSIYILPIILNLFPKSLNHILKRILDSGNGKIEQIQISAALSVLKVARRNGIITGDSLLNKIGDSDDINLSIPYIIQKAMNCVDHVTRLDALQLISDSRKLTEIPNEIEFSNLLSYLHSTLSHTLPTYRTKSYPHLELFCQRIKDGALSKYKKIKKDDSNDELHLLIDYVEKLCKKVTWAMYSSSSFHRKTTAYEYFSILVNLFGEKPTRGCNFNDVTKLVDRDFQIFNPDSIKLVFSGILDSYDQNRITAHKILNKCPGKLPGFETHNTFIPLIKWAIRNLTSPRMRECDSASLILRIIVEKYIIHSGWSIRVLNNGENIDLDINSKDSLDVRFVKFLDDIHNIIIFYHDSKNEDDCYPTSIHGLFMAIRYILNDFPFNKIENTLVWSTFLRRIIETSKQISLKALDITHSIRYRLDDNNEDDSEIDSIDQFIVVVTWLNIKEIAFLLGCIVKSLLPKKATSLNNILEVKEIEAIGQHLLDILLVLRHRGAIETTSDGFQVVCEALAKCNIVELKELPQKWLNQLLYRIEYTPRQLMSTRRSAGLPYAFIALLKSEAFTEHDRKVHNLLPRAFNRLLQIVNRVEEPQEPSMKPEYRHQVHALNVIRAILRDKFLIEDVGPFVEEILMVVIKLYTSSIWHVQNSATMAFSALIERCTGSKQSFDDDGENFTRKLMSGITISDFFTRFPNTHPFLVKAVNESLQNVQTESSYVNKILKNSNYEIGCNNVPNDSDIEQNRKGTRKIASLATNLYAVLVLITRLKPGRMESPKDKHLTEPFLKAVLESSVSSDWMIRKLSARALVRLIPTTSFPSFLNGFIESLPSSRENCFKEFKRNTSNQLHGILLSIYYLMKGHLPLIVFNDVLDDLFGNVMPKIQKFNWIFETNVHPLSSQLLQIIYEFVIIDSIVSHYDSVNQLRQTYNKISKHILFNSGIYTPVMDHYLIEMASKVSVYYALHYEKDKEEAISYAIFAMNHPYYEARISALELLEEAIVKEKYEHGDEFVLPLIQLLGIDNSEYSNEYGFIEDNVKAISIIFSILNTLKILPSNLLIQCSTLTQDGKDNIWTYISRIVENRDSYSDSLVQSSLEFMGTVIKELTQFVLLNKYNYKDYFVILDLWNQFCLSYSKMDIPLEYRQSATRSLTHCVLSIEIYNKLKGLVEEESEIQSHFVKYWLNVIRLLQDDDDNIRALMVPLCSSMTTTNTNDSVNLLLNIHLSIELCYHNLSKYMGDCSYYIEHLISNLSYKCPSSIYDDKSIIFEVDKENYFVEECFIAQISRREISFILKNYNHVKLLQIQKWSSNLEHELNLFIGHIKDNNDFYGEWNMYNEDIFNGLYINLLGISCIVDYDKEFYKDSNLLKSLQDVLTQKLEFIHPIVQSLIRYILNRVKNIDIEETDSLNFLLEFKNANI